MCIFVFIGELFFRAPTLTVAFSMLKTVFTDFHPINTIKSGKLLTLGLDINDFLVIFIGIIVVFIIGLLKEKNHNIREDISKKRIVVRWVILYLLILSIIIFGAYGPGYIPVDPIYADF